MGDDYNPAEWTPVNDTPTDFSGFGGNIADTPDPWSSAGGFTGASPISAPAGGNNSNFSWADPATWGISPGAVGGLLGMLGGAGGSLGSLLSGGQGPTTNQSGSSNQSGNSNFANNQSGNTWNTGNTNTFGNTVSNTSQNGVTNTSGFNNSSQTPTLDPSSQAAIDRLTQLLGGPNAQAASGAFGSGLSMLTNLLQNQTNGGGVSMPTGPNTTPANYDPGDPFSYDQKLMDVVKQSFGNSVSDIAGRAITGARERGFAGGADLLGTAAAPIAGQALAEMPAAEAKAYLDHVLQGYTARNAAQIGGMNAATNALMPGVQAYGSQVQGAIGQANAETNRTQALGSLINSLMNPYQNLINSNLGMVNAIPHGMQGTTLTGGTSNQNLSGTTNTNQTGGSNSFTLGGSDQSNTGQTNTSQSGNTSGTGNTQTPIGGTIGNTIGNILAGGAQGYASGANPNRLDQNTLLRLLLQGRA